MIPTDTNDDKEQVKRLLFYQVENLKDDYEDLEEKYYHLNLSFKDRNRNLELLIRDFRKLAEEMKYMNVYLEMRRTDLKNKLCPTNDCNGTLTNGFHEDKPTSSYRNGHVLGNPVDDLKEENDSTENDFSSLENSLETDSNGLLVNFQSLVNSYVQSLTDYKVSRLEQFKAEVLKVEAGPNCFALLDLVNSLNGDDLNDKIKNFVSYKRKLDEHLSKLARQLKQEKERVKQFSERSPIDLNNLNKLNLESLNLNKLDENEEDSDKNLLELKYALLKVEDSLEKAKRLQANLERGVARYTKEKEATEARIDNLKNDKRKLLRELRDADARITELTTETMHNQKIIEQLKKNS